MTSFMSTLSARRRYASFSWISTVNERLNGVNSEPSNGQKFAVNRQKSSCHYLSNQGLSKLSISAAQLGPRALKES